jgi:hypothetical protein
VADSCAQGDYHGRDLRAGDTGFTTPSLRALAAIFSPCANASMPAYVREEHVDRLEAPAADLGVEVHPARRQAALPQDHQHGLCCLVQVGRELAGVPAQQQIAAVALTIPSAPEWRLPTEKGARVVTGSG